MTQARPGRVVTFYSYKGGVGRTMALANTAWILAANGKRVLAVDWDLEAPGLHRYFHPFLDPGGLAATSGVIDLLQEYAWAATAPTGRGSHPDAWHLPYARVEPHALSVDPERLGAGFLPGGSLDLLPAGRQNPAYSATVSAFDWDNFYDRLGGTLFLDAVREDMKATYDYVLIDSRTGLSDIADICTVQMPDVLVDCFTFSQQSLEGAASVAHGVARHRLDRGIRVLPVPMRVEGGETRVTTARAVAREVFDGVLRGMRGEDAADDYWDRVEIPYRPSYAYEERLAAFGDAGDQPGSLLSAYERLTGVISDGEVAALPQVPEGVRQRCRAAFGRFGS